MRESIVKSRLAGIYGVKKTGFFYNKSKDFSFFTKLFSFDLLHLINVL